MANDIENMIQDCPICARKQKSLPAQQEIVEDKPEDVIVKMGSDFFEFRNRKYLLLSDYLSGYIWVSKEFLRRTPNSQDVIDFYKATFDMFGWPKVIRIDADSRFLSRATRGFMIDNFIKIQVASPGHHQSNGLAEANVGVAKSIIRICMEDKSDFREKLSYFLDSPQQNGFPSPAALLFKRQIRLPQKPCIIRPRDGFYEREATRLWEKKEQAKTRRNSRISKFNRKQIQPKVGLRVLLQSEPSGPGKPGRFELPAKITAVDYEDEQRSCWVELLDGSSYKRNVKNMEIDPEYEYQSEDSEDDERVVAMMVRNMSMEGSAEECPQHKSILRKACSHPFKLRKSVHFKTEERLAPSSPEYGSGPEGLDNAGGGQILVPALHPLVPPDPPEGDGDVPVPELGPAVRGGHLRQGAVRKQRADQYRKPGKPRRGPVM